MINASLAQLVEQLICNQQVVSSNLTGSSIFMRSSSAVEQVTVNHLVASSILAFAAIFNHETFIQHNTIQRKPVQKIRR